MNDMSSGMKKWLSAVAVVVCLLGMVWLASLITAHPEEAVRFAGKFGGLIWTMLAAGSLLTLWAKKRMQRRHSLMTSGE